MAVNFIGKEDLEKHLKTFKHIHKIEVCEKETSKRAICIFSKEAGEPVALLMEYLGTQENYESAKFSPYYIKVFLKGPNTKNENGFDCVGFTFAFADRFKSLTVNGPVPGALAGMPSANDLFTLYSERGFLQAENRRLSDRILDLESEISEFEDQEPGAGVGAVEGPEKWLNILSQVKDMFPGLGGLLAGGSAPADAISGDTELSNIIAELQMTDPMFKERMKEYLQVVKNGTRVKAGNDQNNTGVN